MKGRLGAVTATAPPLRASCAARAAVGLAGVATLWVALVGAGPIPAATGDIVRQLVLVGIVLGHRAGPLAVIEDKRTGRDGWYHVGDAVAGAAVIAITADRAVLRSAGQNVELRLAASRSGRGHPARLAPVPPRPRSRSPLGRVPFLGRRIRR